MKIFRKYSKEFSQGLYAVLGLLSFYLLVMRISTGSWEESLNGFLSFWPWLTSLTLGFGAQMGLYTRLHALHQNITDSAIAGTSAATSGAAMVACCAHHLSDIFPILGLSGAAVFLAQYQLPFIGFGLFTNLAGIGYLSYQIRRLTKLGWNHKTSL